MDSSKKSGIILYETIISAVIITVCISITLRAFSTSLRSAKATEHYLQANVLIKNKFADFFLMPSLDAGEYEGTFTDEPGSIAWNAIIEDVTETEELTEESNDVEETKKPDFFKIILSVTWVEGRNPKKISMTSLISKEEPETQEITSDIQTVNPQELISDEIREQLPSDEGAAP